MSQVFAKLQEIESQIDGEIKQIGKKITELLQEKRKLSNLQRLLKPKTLKKKKVEKVERSNSVLLSYKKYLKNNVHVTTSTKNKYLTVAKIYLKELHRLGYLATDITVNIKNFKQNKKYKRVGLNDDEINLLINNLSNTDDYRLRAILALLTLQGLRQIEIVRLNLQDIDFEQKTMMVTGKGADIKN